MRKSCSLVVPPRRGLNSNPLCWILVSGSIKSGCHVKNDWLILNKLSGADPGTLNEEQLNTKSAVSVVLSYLHWSVGRSTVMVSYDEVSIRAQSILQTEMRHH